MSERSELRRRRGERMENGVKNLKVARLFPKTFSNHGFGDASFDNCSLIPLTLIIKEEIDVKLEIISKSNLTIFPLIIIL